MPVSRTRLTTRLTLLPGGLSTPAPEPAVTQPGGSPLVVDAVLTVQVGRQRGASEVTLTRGDDGHWQGRIGSSRETRSGAWHSVDTVLDVMLQRAVGHPGPPSDSRRRV